MTKLKPVWRMNKGLGVPSDLGDKILLKGETSQVPEWMLEWHQPWRLDIELPVTAYQTNRAKAAKFDRVMCDSCGDSRFKGTVFCGGYFEYRECNKCNGTGRMARRTT